MSRSVHSKEIKDSLCLVDKCVPRRHAVFEPSQGFGDGFSEYYIRPCHLSVNFFRLVRAGILRVGGIVFGTGEERRSNKSIEQTLLIYNRGHVPVSAVVIRPMCTRLVAYLICSSVVSSSKNRC